MEYINDIKYDYLKENDIDTVLEIQKLVYTKDLLESKETFLSMINNYPSGCLCLRNNNIILGYFITHPENINNLPLQQYCKGSWHHSARNIRYEIS